MSSAWYKIPGSLGAVPVSSPRLEIHDFVKDEKYFTLYIRALTEIDARNESTDITSAFQIGGIHGYPLKPWKGGDDSSNGNYYYCEHGTTLFPPWHRPYMSLYELVIHEAATRIAKEYKKTPEEEKAWADAAETLRLPYWDWAANGGVPPTQVFRDKEVRITKPDGTRPLVANPFLEYTFREQLPSLPAIEVDWTKYPKTVRHSKEGQTTSDPDALETTLKETFKETRDKIYATLTKLHNWDDFSNHISNPLSFPRASSLESVHDGMHVNIGGLRKDGQTPSGHMCDADVAAFDPIFYLHHANIDRFLALWQAMNPGIWTSEEDGEKDLKPFRDLTNGFWKSNNAYKYSDILKYTYPEFAGLDHLPPQELKEAIEKKVDELYKSSTRADPHDLTLHVRCKKFELGGSSFRVPIFWGEPPADPEQWFASPNYVGSHAIFAGHGYQGCSNCVEHADDLVETILDLNHKIQELPGYGTPLPFDPQTVGAHLKAKLDWRVLKAGEARADLPSLEIVPVYRPPGRFNQHIPLANITRLDGAN